MSTDDPFSSGSERTVLRPNPGGRRGGPPGGGPPGGGGPPPPGGGGGFAGTPRGGDAAAPLPAIGNNPLATAAAPLLALAVRLRSTAAVANVEALRARVIDEIRGFERRVSAANLPRETMRGGHYAICATIDDVINNTPWGTSGQWAAQSMCRSFHNDVAGGERFFDFLGHFQKEPGRYTDVLELMYLCLSLGFEGRMRVSQRGASELNRTREGLFNLLRQNRGEPERALSPQWRGLEAPHRPLTSVLPAWVIAVAVAAVLTLVYVVFVFLLNDRSDSVSDKFALLPPAGPVTLNIAAPAPPPVQRDELVQRLSTFLEPEVKAGLVTVSGTPQTAMVRVRGNDLFSSGTATLNDKYLPLIGRIAAALDKEQGSVLVIGHTDNVPIRSLRFPSNFQLSVARAETVRDLLRHNVTERREISAEGRADGDPIASNSTPEGRAANRRTEVVLTRQDNGQ
jgi:type VI secretion system protein ImpK